MSFIGPGTFDQFSKRGVFCDNCGAEMLASIMDILWHYGKR